MDKLKLDKGGTFVSQEMERRKEFEFIRGR